MIQTPLERSCCAQVRVSKARSRIVPVTSFVPFVKRPAPTSVRQKCFLFPRVPTDARPHVFRKRDSPTPQTLTYKAKSLLLPSIFPLMRSAAEAESLDDFGGGSCEHGRGVAVVVDPFIARKLRPHQREGVRWMYRVLHGLDKHSDSQARASKVAGCLLADDMGLGKSLQSVALVWTMLRQGPRGIPTAKRVLLVCPASLVGAWGAEFNKWLGGVRAQTALAEGGGMEAVDAYERWERGPPSGTKSAFDHWPVLVTSYETLRRLAPIAANAKPELLICDEAHRLRNASQESQTLASLRMIDIPRRVLLTGTPIQNNLDEYAALMDFACPGILGPVDEFHRQFTLPVQRGVEPDATPMEIDAARKAAKKLGSLTAGHVLRRESSINAAHLPAKTEIIVFCSLTETQRTLYEKGASVVQGWASGTGNVSGLVATGNSEPADALCAIGLLRQLANSVDHLLKTPPTTHKGGKKNKTGINEGNDTDDTDDGRPKKQARCAMQHDLDADDWFSDDEKTTPSFGSAVSSNKDASTTLRKQLSRFVPTEYCGGVEGSGKLMVLKLLLIQLVSSDSGSSKAPGTRERMVIVSGFSAALDSVAAICDELGITTDRLDGRLPPEARPGLVRKFNAGHGGRVLLLSCLAGGAGLNLVGASRLVLFDSSWNPAHDHQAMARVWRDGQIRPVTIYRLISAGTVEEKVFQRQLLKHAEAVIAGVGGEGIGVGAGSSTRFSRDELSKLVAFSSSSQPLTLAAAGWEDSKDAVQDPLLRAAVEADGSTVTAVVKLAGDGGRAKAVEAAKRELAEEKLRVGPKTKRPKRFAFADLLSKAKKRG